MSQDQPRHRDGKFAPSAHSEQDIQLTPDRWGHLTGPAQRVLDAVGDLDLRPGAASRAVQDPSPLVRWHGLDQGYDLPDTTFDRVSSDPGVRWVDRIMHGGRLEPYPA